ncbi:hypothetical protein [Chryseobacterium sp. WLY505]|uniref:hypothetical protein n=1 Tax=Chryseobacterium sp. WLY505 TaxID=3068892 RepID=UPI002796BFC3|nr:hypothetical protein [Chryseobacterium sp. WLY505]MDQ1855626.1 hypothetical protein [Chryseobacterium sp. WLY505]
MTLCLAWKQEQEIYFASDSRLTNPDKSKITDDATKIFKIGVEIYDAISSETPNAQEELLHRTNFGLCFTGSYLNGSLLADTIEEVLSNLQGSPQISDFSIDNLSDIAFAIYKQVSRQLTTINREKGVSEVLLGGYCPINKNFKLYKFSPDIQEGLLDFTKETVDIDKSPYFIGDITAKSRAEELVLKIDEKYSQFHLLREIITDNNIPTVGGNIQIGAFRSNNFKTHGIIEYSSFKNEHGLLEVKDNFKFRGLSLDFNDNELRKGNINIKKAFLNPFKNERDLLFKQVLESINKNTNNFKTV